MEHGTYNPNGQRTQFTKKKYFKVKADSSLLVRVLPPFGSMSKSGNIAKYWSIFWFKDTQGRNRPVPSILKKNRDGEIIQRDPVLDKADALNLQVKQLENDPKVSKEELQLAKDKAFALQPDKNYYLNVLTPSNEIGILSIRYTAFQALKLKIDELREKQSIDAINLGPENGVFFEIKRQKDQKGKTIYTVEVATAVSRDPKTNKVNVEYMMAPIDETILKRMENEAADLGEMYKEKSFEDMAALATLDPKMVDRVFMRGEPVKEVTESTHAADAIDESHLDTSIPTGPVIAQAQNSSSANLEAARKALFGK